MGGAGGGGTLGRSWRRFRRRSTATQALAVVVTVAVVAAVVAAVAVSGGSKGTSTTTTGAAGVPSVDTASTSAAGVTPTAINVVFPVSNLVSLSSNFGFAGDAEFDVQKQAITTFVDAVNKAGGINGRHINAEIVNFDPTNEAGMRSLCKQWTEGGAQVFAVLDGIGAWTGDNELCVTQEGHTPFIGQWSTVTSYTTEGAPYLWWTGPDQAQVLATLVQWAKRTDRIGGSHRLGIVAGDRSSDQLALTDYLLPDLRAAGVSDPVVETLPAETSESASTSSDAPLVVQKLEQAGVDAVIPLIPFNAFFPYLSAETSEHWFPQLLLSDYESTIQLSLGLIPQPYEQALEGQEGITTLTLGGTDAPIAQSKGGYDPGVAACYRTWVAAGNKPVSNVSPYIEEQGPIAGWCQAINLFATAARKAGRDLNRRTFAEAMATVENYPGTWSPSLSYGPTRYAGPDEYRVVSLHNNVPPGPLCVPTYTGKPQGTCWHIVSNWAPLVG